MPSPAAIGAQAKVSWSPTVASLLKSEPGLGGTMAAFCQFAAWPLGVNCTASLAVGSRVCTRTSPRNVFHGAGPVASQT